MAEAQAYEHPRDATRLDGRVAIVTGAGSRGEGVGNGRATSVILARRGAKVLLLDIEAAWMEATARMIAAEGGECAVQTCDVAEEAQCRAAVEAAVKRWGRLDILVNNVGISGPPGDATQVDPAGWDHAMRVNVASIMLMAKYAIPEMRKAGGGAIVNLASIAGLQGGHPGLLYPTSKGAIVQMTRAMASHHGPEGIRVNAVAPGYVYTPMVASRGMTEELRRMRREMGLLKTEGTAWDVAEAVAFLASPAARWITGHTLPVDSGRSSGTTNRGSPVPDGERR
jgi:NAD(P)-dependent dehydrogenase (short-subunit alcohol dehydrogenase family)